MRFTVRAAFQGPEKYMPRQSDTEPDSAARARGWPAAPFVAALLEAALFEAAPFVAAPLAALPDPRFDAMACAGVVGCLRRANGARMVAR